MQDDNQNGINSRRKFLGATGKMVLGAGLIGAVPAIARAESCKPSYDYSSLKYQDPEWNRDARARMLADLEFGKQKFGWYAGIVNGVRDNEKIRPLFGFEGFSFARLIDKGDGVYQKVLREVGFYTDLETGEVLEHWDNPYTGERVRVVHIANDPFNHEISAYFPDPPSYGGLNKADKPPKRPFIMNWRDAGHDTVLLQTPINLFYPSALQPEEWPRESPGKMSRVSEMFNFVIRKSELADTSKTSIEYSGSWARITPWLPWMLMDQAPGHIYYDCLMGSYHDMSVLSPKVRAYAEKHHPKYFEAPTEWVEPSLSSLEMYKLEQKPAPVKK